MIAITKSLCWAAALIALALANAAGWIADKDANLLFALIPVLWIAIGGLGRNCPRKVAI
jgi:hypothetical protein